jgi:hypothetical protein
VNLAPDNELAIVQLRLPDFCLGGKCGQIETGLDQATAVLNAVLLFDRHNGWR